MTKEMLSTPCYLLDQGALKKNLSVLSELEKETGAKVLLAEKAFACTPLLPLVRDYLSGASASGLFEAKLSAEEIGKETHVFSAGYREEEFLELMIYADHFSFNSMSQLSLFGKKAKAAGKKAALRINPECSTGETAMYDPCAPHSRLGVTRKVYEEKITPELLSLIDGLHFHTLCEQDAYDLKTTINAVEKNWKDLLQKVSYINLGGGLHITKTGFAIEVLKDCIRHLQNDYGLAVYLEPGEAVAYYAGELIATVLDITENEGKIAILDASAACHMPDVLEMPYRPPVKDAGAPGEKRYDYLLGGPTCLSGDVIGTYSFDRELARGDRVTFCDMAIYTFVKNNTFNGMPLPSIALQKESGEVELLKTFGYRDFLERLG